MSANEELLARIAAALDQLAAVAMHDAGFITVHPTANGLEITPVLEQQEPQMNFTPSYMDVRRDGKEVMAWVWRGPKPYDEFLIVCHPDVSTFPGFVCTMEIRPNPGTRHKYRMYWGNESGERM